jgi:hypothetical protein
MKSDIGKAIKLLHEVENLREIQRDRGYNTFRAEMIEKMLFDVQSEIFHALNDNNKELA